MKPRVLIPLTILLIFSYLIFIFPFEIISSWLGYSTSLQETVLSTAFVYLVCLYYFRSKSSNKIIKLFVYEGIGIGTLSLFIVFFILLISFILNINEAQKIFIFFITFIPLIIYGFFNAKIVSVKQLKFSHSKIKKKIKFIFLSDIHIGSNSPKILKKIIPLINQHNPSFVLVGGDLIDSSSFKIQDLDEMKKINAPIYFVTGNHEHYIEDSQKHLNDFKNQNIKILDNENVLVDRINIIGLSDNQTKENKINKFEQLFDSDYFNLLLVHQPSIWNSLKEKANLTLSGHTHNGQIFPFNLVVKIQFPQIYGVYSYLKNYLYVSSGAATWGPKIRIGSKNEILNIELTNNS
ncbi:Calcineurin-like phosphoesterase [alpha proteobacterium HIMB59]|nr:Calcineurin-like phosphoesterase [alpha proteobacterium HIMB59]